MIIKLRAVRLKLNIAVPLSPKINSRMVIPNGCLGGTKAYRYLIIIYSGINYKKVSSFHGFSQILRRNRQRIRKIPLKSTISEGFWSE